MKKALIIGPSFFHYNESIGRAFRELGYQTQLLPYDEPLHPFTLKNSIIHKLSFNRERLKSKSRKAFNQFARKEFNVFNPDVVFIYNGDILEPETVICFKETAKVAVWMLDGVYRHPRSEALAPLVDAYFCFEKSDVALLEEKGIKSCFLPQACDTSIYYPVPMERDIDILFVGTLYNYPNRIKLLKSVVKRFPTLNIQVYGIYKPFYKNPLKWLFREKRTIFKNKNIPPPEVNRLYNRAKINLNIHHEQSGNGANPKVFEIAGARAFQLSDWNPYLESLFPCGEVGLFRTKEELFAMIDYYLPGNTTEAAEKANKEVVKNHTFVNRIREALTILSLSE